MRIIALEYHDIVRDQSWDESGFSGAAAATYKMSVADFEAHLAAVRRVGCPVVHEVTRVEAASPVPVVWTFDDGGAGYLSHAADLLERHGWRGCVFMTTGCIGKPGFLSAGDLRALHQRGHVIGTHSRSHPQRLAALTETAIAEEWRASIQDLQDALGHAVAVGSVPGGYHSTAVARQAAACGLTTLFTSEPERRVTSVDGCLVVGRYTLRRGDHGSYAARLVGRSPVARASQWCRWNAKKVAKSLGGRNYLRLRERLIGRDPGPP